MNPEYYLPPERRYCGACESERPCMCDTEDEFDRGNCTECGRDVAFGKNHRHDCRFYKGAIHKIAGWKLKIDRRLDGER